METLKKSRYSVEGKITEPITQEDFEKFITEAPLKLNQKAYLILLYYSAVRTSEALRSKKENFQITKKAIMFSVGKRLKHGIETPPLRIPRNATYVNLLEEAIKSTNPEKKVFSFSRKTAYNIARRAGFHYSHFFRLNRITNFFLDGWTIAQVHSWTGLTLKALDYYIGLVDIQKMGDSLNKNQKEQ